MSWLYHRLDVCQGCSHFRSSWRWGKKIYACNVIQVGAFKLQREYEDELIHAECLREMEYVVLTQNLGGKDTKRTDHGA